MFLSFFLFSGWNTSCWLLVLRTNWLVTAQLSATSILSAHAHPILWRTPTYYSRSCGPRNLHLDLSCLAYAGRLFESCSCWLEGAGAALCSDAWSLAGRGRGNGDLVACEDGISGRTRLPACVVKFLCRAVPSVSALSRWRYS